MALRRYGVMKGRVVDYRHAIASNPHFQILINAGGEKFRASVNVKSNAFPSELLYYAIDDFEHPMTDILRQLSDGFTHLANTSDSGALDYIRDNLFVGADMVVMPYTKPGPDNDLNEKLEVYIKRAIKEEDVHPESREVLYPVIYAFGERWGPEKRTPDKIFGFKPGNGVHDIHMNQGNIKRWQRDDGVWQDGGLLFYFPKQEQWSAVFLAFQTQSFHTDDKSGRRLLHEPKPEHPEPIAHDNIPARMDKPIVRIVAALVNPPGEDAGKETITLKNTTRATIHLDNWMIVDKNRRYEVLQDIKLSGGTSRKVRLSGTGAQLSNKGGTISLLNPDGIKIDGVAYSKSQVARRRAGKELKFR